RVGILGPNGAGKSTLLMLISGLFEPTEGIVRVFGAPPSRRGSRPIVGLGFQDPNDQLFCPTLLEDVAFGPLNMGLPKEKAVERAKEAIRAVGLGGLEDKPPHRLSVGEKKKASLATVLAMEPRVMALDEPTSNLDPKSRRELAALLNELYGKLRFTFIVATHDVNFACEVAERAFILNGGEIVREGKLPEILLDSKFVEEVGLEPPARFTSRKL
ncbi:TPA: energy-coupling factor ABC transporter ATP-binding protein, partial [Candidatus Bathyarchaeota archaeon]|nr:energy-coupling factor ABC transporter ATP-binding protein [Candidatus Bathyarchaeota archaeon]